MTRRLADLGPLARTGVVAGVLFWGFLTIFPIYWVVITAFKAPTGVFGGPTYIPSSISSRRSPPGGISWPASGASSSAPSSIR